MAKNLGLKPKDEQKAETVREFDDLIETLRTGEKEKIDVNYFHYDTKPNIFFLKATSSKEVKNTKDLARQKVATHLHGTSVQMAKTRAKEFFK